MSEGTDIYTTLGLTKIRNAAGSGSQVRISHVALGDGSGAAYAPEASQTTLRRELLREPIERHYKVGTNAWAIKASFPPESTSIVVREMGFLDEDGDLIALWAGLDVSNARRTGTISYLINHVMTFQGIADGVVIIDAPDDDTFNLAVATATSLASLQLEQLRQAELLRRLTGRY